MYLETRIDKTNLAPIALFVYNRPSHTRQTAEALRNNVLAGDSDLFVFCDAAKNGTASDAVRDVRAYVKTISGFKSVSIVERDQNLGLANSIIGGVTRLCEEFGRVIVLEDDLITAPNFLTYMNEALDKYAGQAAVYSISGYSFTSEIEDIASTYFLTLPSSWGWATWHDKWSVFGRRNELIQKSLRNPNFRREFNYGNVYDYARMAVTQIAGRSDSWAIYWYFSIFSRAGLTLFPGKSLVQNIGRDNSGTHTGEMIVESPPELFEPKLTSEVFEKPEHKRIIQKILRNSSHLPLLARVREFLRRVLQTIRH